MGKFLLFLLFAWPAWAQEQATDPLTAAGCGPSNVQFDVKKDKNLHLTGQLSDRRRGHGEDPPGGPTVRLGVDGEWIGATQYHSYFFFPVNPGEHHMCAGWQSNFARVAKIRAAASFTAEAGKVYYFRIVSEVRTKREPAVKIEPLDSAEGPLLIASSALSTSKTKK